ncbi:hypothetical protein C1645_852966 [Glomus cerebriforme]|uniref:Uncharacterized protein n=1 Tax=Glomus cerebriforme TaxID=658196 RepID=A0A397THZ6_9GLOM|nr:hypothetical protein C1645_852966 [Glomus cerebriforme]
MSFIYAHDVITSMMDESIKEHKINFIKSIFNFASCEEIDIALQDCEGDETLVLYKMSFSMYLESIRQIIKERQIEVYLSCLISDEQKEIAAKYKKNEEIINIETIPPILNENLACSSSSTNPSLPTSPTSPATPILQSASNTNIDNVELSDNPFEYNNHHLFRNVCSNEPQKKGKWSEEEDILFMNRLEEFGHHGPWGEFSLVIPGRSGYQCRDHYKALVKRGRV